MKTKNQLIGLCISSSSPGLYEPTLVQQGGQKRQLPKTGYIFRPDLVGMVHQCGGLPIVGVGEAGLCVVLNPTQEVQRNWEKSE